VVVVGASVVVDAAVVDGASVVAFPSVVAGAAAVVAGAAAVVDELSSSPPQATRAIAVTGRRRARGDRRMAPNPSESL